MVPQLAAELAAEAEAKPSGPVAEAPRPSFSSNQGYLLPAAVLGASLQAVELAAQPRTAALVAESMSQARAVLRVESAALVAQLKLNPTWTPRSCRDRNSVETAPGVRAR